MALEADGSKLFLSKGAVFFKRKELAGVATGLEFLGQVTKLEGRPQGEIITERSAVQKSAGIIAQDKITVDDQIALTFKELDARKLSWALMGSLDAYTQAATAVTNEAFSDVKQGAYIQTAKRKIGTVTVTGVGGSPTYTGWTLEDADAGLIRITPGGDIADGTEIEVDYAPTAITAPGLNRVNAGVTPFIEGELLYIGDPIRGKKLQLKVWRLSIQTQSVIPLIQHDNNQYAEFELLGTVLSDAIAHPTCPYYELLEVA